MELFKKLRTTITGSVAGSCIVLLNQTTPMDMTRDFHTLEELSYQDERGKEASERHDWSFQWVVDRGFVLVPGRKTGTRHHTVGLRRAVYRTVVTDKPDEIAPVR